MIWVACDPSFSSCFVDRRDGVEVLDMLASGGLSDEDNAEVRNDAPSKSSGMVWYINRKC